MLSMELYGDFIMIQSCEVGFGVGQKQVREFVFIYELVLV